MNKDIDEVKKELEEQITYIFKDELELKYNCELIRKELYNNAKNCMSIQFYYNKEYNAFYIYYRLDWKMIHEDRHFELIAKLNGRLVNCLHEGIFRTAKIDIIEPTGEFDKFNYNIYHKHFIDQNTFSYWQCLDGVNEYKFLTGAPGYIKIPTYYNPQDFYIGNDNEERIKRESFLKEIKELNIKYHLLDSYNNSDFYLVDKVFQEYKEIYQRYYNKTLTPIRSQDISTLYFEIIYKGKENKIDVL